MSFLRLFVETNSVQVISNIIQLITSIILARGLGATGKGAYSATQAILEIITYLFLFGLGTSILYAGSRYRDKKSVVAFLAAFFSFFTGIFAALAIIMLATTKNPVVSNLRPEYLLIVAPVALFAIFQSNLTYLLYSQEKYRQANLRIVISNIVMLIFFAVLYFSGKMTVKSALFATLAANIVSALFYLVVVVRQIGIEPVLDKVLIKQMLSLSLKSYLISLMGYIIVRSDLIILNSIKGNYETGIYSIAGALAGKFLLIGSSINTIISPRVIKDPESQFQFQLKATRILAFFMFFVIFLADILYYPAVYTLYGKEFTKSLVPFLILNPGIIALCLNSSLFPYFTSRGLPQISIFAPFTAATLNIVLNLILIPYFGYNAAAATSSLSYITQLIILAGYIIKKENVTFSMMFRPQKQEIIELFNRFFIAIRARYNREK